MPATYHCEICNTSVAARGKVQHLSTKKHATNATNFNKMKGKGVPTNPNTLKTYNNAAKYFDDITEYMPPEDAYGHVKSQNPDLKDSSIHTIIRMGYFRDNINKWDSAKINAYTVYLADLKDSFISEQFDKETEAEELPDIKKIFHNESTPLAVKLYTMLPLRVDSFNNLRITTNPLPEQNNINPETGSITLFNGKTNKYDTFKLAPNVIKFIDSNTKALENKPLISSVRSFQRTLLDKYGTNTQLIRRAYAETVKPKTYAARVLQHSNTTHRGHYIR